MKEDIKYVGIPNLKKDNSSSSGYSLDYDNTNPIKANINSNDPIVGFEVSAETARQLEKIAKEPVVYHMMEFKLDESLHLVYLDDEDYMWSFAVKMNSKNIKNGLWTKEHYIVNEIKTTLSELYPELKWSNEDIEGGGGIYKINSINDAMVHVSKLIINNHNAKLVEAHSRVSGTSRIIVECKI